MIDDTIKDLYRRFLYERITRDEVRLMNAALDTLSDEELEGLLEDEWKRDLLVEPMLVEEKQHIKDQLNRIVSPPRKRIQLNGRLLFTAAALLSFVFLGIHFYDHLLPGENKFVVKAGSGNRTYVTLPDKSEVWLNSNSTLNYGSQAWGKREADLEGEAFFHIAKDAKRPFLVKTGLLVIEVLGTSFNVRATPGRDVIETSLVEGSVKLILPDKTYLLKPNEKAIYSKKDASLKIIPTDNEMETAWKNNKLKFKSERLIDVKVRLEEWYNLKIKIDCKEIENDLITGTFNNERLDIVLESLEIQYGIRYRMEGDTVIISCK